MVYAAVVERRENPGKTKEDANTGNKRNLQNKSWSEKG